jgi:hypothetical protein
VTTRSSGSTTSSFLLVHFSLGVVDSTRAVLARKATHSGAWDFKYDEELTQTYMPSNQIGVVFTRPEASSKYLFGFVSVLGTANNSIITGVFITQATHPICYRLCSRLGKLHLWAC